MNGDQLVVQWDPIAVGVWITFRQPLSAMCPPVAGHETSSGCRSDRVLSCHIRDRYGARTCLLVEIDSGSSSFHIGLKI